MADFIKAPYGMCAIHNVPYEVLFTVPFCPLCEAVDRSNPDCKNGCGDICRCGDDEPGRGDGCSLGGSCGGCKKC